MWFDRGAWPAWVAWGALTGILAVALLLVATADAWPRMHAPYRGHRIIPVGGAPPLDNMTTPTGAYSFRKLKSTYAGPAVRIRRASDNLEADINFLGFVPGLGAPWDAAAATAHCASTSCFIVTLYDQSGVARDWTNATPATQMPLVFNCNGANPCWVLSDTGAYGVSGANLAPATGVASLNAVFRRVSATGQCLILRQNGPANNRMVTRAGAAGVTLTSAVGSIFTVLTENAWHSVVGVINGASSSVTGETGTPGSGSVTGNTTLGQPGVIGAATTTCQGSEAIFWDNYVLTAGEIAALNANQRSFWGIP